MNSYNVKVCKKYYKFYFKIWNIKRNSFIILINFFPIAVTNKSASSKVFAI